MEGEYLYFVVVDKAKETIWYSSKRYELKTVLYGENLRLVLNFSIFVLEGRFAIRFIRHEGSPARVPPSF